MRRMPILTADRIHIRPFTHDDLPAAIAVFDGVEMSTATESVITNRQAWLNWNVANEYYLASLDQPPYGERAIVHTASTQIIGAIGLVPCVDVYARAGIGAPDDGRTQAEVGLYWNILPTWRQQGYASEAARCLVDYACGPLGLRRIIATTEHTNVASQGVMRTLGMELRTNPHADPPWLQVVGVYEPARRIHTYPDGTYLRPITLADLPNMLTLWRAATLQLSPTDSELGLRRHLAISGNLAWMLCGADGGILGTVLGSDDGRRGWINHLAVHPDAQGLGYGARLIEAVVARLRQQGCEKVNLLVRHANRQVIPFYEKQGFAIDDNVFMAKWIQHD